MKKKTLWIAETAVMLAMLIALQWLTKPLGQLVTGSCVNTVLAVSVLFCGVWSGAVVALVSPVMAYLLGIAPQILTVPAIMVGNLVFILLLCFVTGEGKVPVWRQITAWLSASVAKFGVLYLLVTQIICGVAAQALLAQGVLKEPMLKVLPAAFSWPQLVTALIGGGLAVLMVPVLKKALHGN